MIKHKKVLVTLIIFLSQRKPFMKNCTPKRKPPKLLLLLTLWAKFLTERKSQVNNSPLWGKYSSEEVTKSINSQKNNKFSGNDGYESSEKLQTMGVSSRAGVISAIYQKGYKKDSISLLNFFYHNFCYRN